MQGINHNSFVRMLIVDDDATMRDFLREFFSNKGYLSDLAIDGEQALKKVNSRVYDLVLVDLMLPGMSGLETLTKIKEIDGNLPVIIITAHATIETAVEATKKGAFDYITKPVSPVELELRVQKALHYSQLLHENRELRRRILKDGNSIIGNSRIMQKLIATIDIVADSKAAILIQGESGTGKELIAEVLHKKSSRSSNPLVKVNCAAIPENLLETELFGCVSGAYTDAKKNRIGKFEAAHKGTVLLDEITETSLSFQAKLLRVLQSMEFEKVGSTKPIKVDVRVIATSNKNIKNEVKKGTFREDLFYRLNVIPITVPSLRKRKKDIPLFVSFFLNKFTIDNRKKPFEVEPEALELMTDYYWPGNIRELENFIHRVVITSPDNVLNANFVRSQLYSSPQSNKNTIFEDIPKITEVERILILKALEQTMGDKKEAANLLGITVRTIYNKLKEYEKDGTRIGKDGKLLEY